MAKKNNLYKAFIETENERIDVNVDIFDLPYDKFGTDVPLVISEDVDMGKSKNHKWPDLGNVAIDGTFDCSDFAIGPDTILPAYFKTLVCKHSINDLSVLVDKLEDGNYTIVIRTSLLNNIKKNKDDALNIARKFVQKLPNVTVTDGKQFLLDILKQIDTPVTDVKSQQTTKNTKIQTVPYKTADWLSADEIVTRCMEQSTEIAKLPKEQVTRLVQMARSRKANLCLKAADMLREDGVSIKCVHQDEISRIIEYILGSITTIQDRIEKTSVPAKKTKSNPKPVPEVNTTKQKYFFDNREINVIKIKKYISKSAWGQILSKVGNDTGTLMRILQDIEDINVNPALAHVASGQVAYVKDNQVQVSPTVGFKNGRCLAQGFGTLDDRPRIVWGICAGANTFVCQNFFPAHEGKIKMKYNALLRTIDIDLSKLDLGEYLLVSDLIEELADGRPTPGAQGNTTHKPSEAKANPTTESKTADCTSDTLPSNVVHQDTISEPLTQQSAPIEQVKTSPVIQPPIPKQKQKISKVTSPNPQPLQWRELYSVHYKYTQRLACLDAQKKLILTPLVLESDTEKSLKLSDDLNKVLQQKKSCEDAISKLKSINQILQEMESQIDSHQK